MENFHPRCSLSACPHCSPSPPLLTICLCSLFTVVAHCLPFIHWSLSLLFLTVVSLFHFCRHRFLPSLLVTVCLSSLLTVATPAHHLPMLALHSYCSLSSLYSLLTVTALLRFITALSYCRCCFAPLVSVSFNFSSLLVAVTTVFHKWKFLLTPVISIFHIWKI